MAGFPVQFSSAGPVPTPPATLNAALISLVASQVPDYTAVLPGSLIEDMSSTAVGALATMDQARVDAINSVSPYVANPYLLALLGAQLGIAQGLPANGSVFVVFTGTAGYVIPPGFLVSDGTNQYAIIDGGVIATGGMSSPLYAVATASGVFPIAAGTVTQIVTSVPSPYTGMTVTNHLAGVPAQAAETVESYRARLLAASQVAISGTQTYLKTLLYQVPGVVQRLVSVLQNGSIWEVIVGGGDPYEVAYAIYQGVSSLGLLDGSSTTPRNITVSIFDTPNTYSVVYVNPPSQELTCAITWNTTLPNFSSGLLFDQLAIAAASSYFNSIPVGNPINLNALTAAIQDATASVLTPVNLTSLSYVVKYGGTTQSPTAGTQIIPSVDSETYLYALAADVTCVQG